MKEKDIHELIEQEEAETKGRIWKKLSVQLNLQKINSQTISDESDSVSNDCKNTGFKQSKPD